MIARIIETVQMDQVNTDIKAVTFKVVLACEKFISNALLLINFTDTAGVAFGTARSQCFSLFPSKHTDLFVSCSIAMLLKGTYYCNAVLLNLNNVGTYNILDEKKRISTFSVEDNGLIPLSVMGYAAMPDVCLKRTLHSELNNSAFTVDLAGKTVKISSHFKPVYEMCADYLVCDKNADISISTDLSELAEESNRDYEITGQRTSLENIEILTVYRKIAKSMLKYDIILMHGTVAGVGNRALMITAKSGEGKTTFIRSFLKHIEGSYVVNGDKPLIRIYDDQPLACGTPWSGKEGMNRNCVIPLKNIFILERGDKNSIQEVTATDAFPVIWQQTNRYNDPKLTLKTMQLIRIILNKVKICRLVFKFYDNKNEIPEDAAVMAYKYMKSTID